LPLMGDITITFTESTVVVCYLLPVRSGLLTVPDA